MTGLRLSGSDIMDYLAEVFPQMAERFTILDLSPMRLSCEMQVTDADLRPGDTISGPAMFTAADCAFYMVTLAMIGREALTVTTGSTINFMRKPPLGPLRAEARLLKLGRSLSVGDVLVYGHGLEHPVAHATMTYSIPPKQAR